MTSPQGHPARREPLLWIQLLGLAALPLEAAALLVVLAGADPGPWPGLERLFCWTLGALAPALLFWKLPPDLWSLLLVQVPLRGRRADQLRLSALQTALPPKGLGAAGALLLLPLLWWSDNHAGIAWSLSPFTTSPRVVVLLLAALLLTLMLWQWQQIVQSLWLFTRPAGRVTETLPLSSNDAAERRLNLGLPLLLLPALTRPASPAAPAAPEPQPEPSNEATPVDPTRAESAREMAEPSLEASDHSEGADHSEDWDEPDAGDDSVAPGTDLPVAVEPEQASEQAKGSDLDQQV